MTTPDDLTRRSDPLARSATRVLVVGAGPIGLETAIELRRRGIDTLNIDQGPLGAQVMAFPPATRWFSGPERISIAGVPLVTADQEKATREEYLAYLRAVVTQFDLPVRTYESVASITRTGDGFEARTRTLGGLERVVEAERIVLAVGGTARPRRLDVPGEDRPFVSHELGEPHRCFGRRVIVVGGKNSAAESAIRLWRAGARVTIVHHREALHPRIKYWIRPEIESSIRSGLIHARLGTRVVEIGPGSVTLEGVADGDRTEVPVDDVLLQIGFEADGSLFEALGCELHGENAAVRHDPGTMETTVSGVHVAGTAVNGTQGSFQVYIENSHIHAQRIAASLAGEPVPADPDLPELPEA